MTSSHTLIVGGGLVGLGIGWELARTGHAVELVERDPPGSHPSAASWAAAGMLAPVTEAGFDEAAQLALGRASLDLYPRWVAELEAAAGMAVDYRAEGTLVAALDRDDDAWLERLVRLHDALGLPTTRLDGAAAREREPHLSPHVTSALASPGDHQVDNRRMWLALREAFRRAGGVLREGREATRLEVRGGRMAGVWARAPVDEGGQEEWLGAERVVVCAGAWARPLLATALPEPEVPPIRPVKGQILSLESSPLCAPTHVVRTRRVYLAPKSDGRLVVGATSEEQGFDTRLTAGGLLELLRHGWETVPGIYDLAVRETWTGLRPAARDNTPILGATSLPGLFVALGYFRNGVLLTPVTARAMGALLSGADVPEVIRPFHAGRFHGRRIST